MSVWFRRKDKQGVRHTYSVSGLDAIIFIVFPTLLALLLPILLWLLRLLRG